MISPATAVNKVFDVVIIGGGLSGLMMANELNRNLPTCSWNLLEARTVLGGRLANDDAGNRIDLGGAWVWPDFQPKMKRLLKVLDIPTFLQPDDPSSTRIDGGAVSIVDALSKKLPQENIRLNTPVTSLSLVQANDVQGQCVSPEVDEEKIIRLDTSAGSILAKRVVLAVPPKLAHKHIQFDPPLSASKQEAMENSHTWMAGVTKVSLVYEKKFWNEQISNMGLPRNLPGPAFQVYDASTKDNSVNAITFFSLVPPGSPAKTDDKILADQVSTQLANAWKLFLGADYREDVKDYKVVHVKHWPTQKYISEDPDPKQIHPHPHPVGALSQSEWNGHLLFAGSETDRQSPGVMEGAVGAAQRAFQELESLV